MDLIYSSITSHLTVSKIDKISVTTQFEPYLYYIAVFIGLILILGILLLIADKVTSKKR
jgi:hypothetical protein